MLIARDVASEIRVLLMRYGVKGRASLFSRKSYVRDGISFIGYFVAVGTLILMTTFEVALVTSKHCLLPRQYTVDVLSRRCRNSDQNTPQ